VNIELEHYSAKAKLNAQSTASRSNVFNQSINPRLFQT